MSSIIYDFELPEKPSNDNNPQDTVKPVSGEMNPRDIAELITNSFTWDQTKQGGPYWLEVYDNLKNINDLES